MAANTRSALVKNERDLIETLGAADRVIALFHASWCPFCIKFLPAFQKSASARETGRHFVVVQDDQEVIADRYSVQVYPTVLYFEKGSVSKRLDGVPGVGLGEKQLTEFIHSCALP